MSSKPHLIQYFLNDQLTELDKDKTPSVQLGDHRTSDHVFTLKSAIAKHVNTTSRGRLYGCFVDFKKA